MSVEHHTWLKSGRAMLKKAELHATTPDVADRMKDDELKEYLRIVRALSDATNKVHNNVYYRAKRRGLI
jgi:hypothetical protein